MVEVNLELFKLFCMSVFDVLIGCVRFAAKVFASDAFRTFEAKSFKFGCVFLILFVSIGLRLRYFVV